ncbi:MAG: hypothetical protein U0744_08475 [Gemmataceae bacterium]
MKSTSFLAPAALAACATIAAFPAESSAQYFGRRYNVYNAPPYTTPYVSNYYTSPGWNTYSPGWNTYSPGWNVYSPAWSNYSGSYYQTPTYQYYTPYTYPMPYAGYTYPSTSGYYYSRWY